MTPEQVVQKQLDAYNARDLETLLQIYREDAQMFEHPAKCLATGSTELRARFATRFREPDLHARLLHRIVLRRTVMDQEEVTRNFTEGNRKLELIMIYEVRGDRIAKAWVIPGAQTLDPRQ